MIDRRIRLAGVRLIEEALDKLAAQSVFNPSLSTLKATSTRKLNTPTATAVVPRVVSPPAT